MIRYLTVPPEICQIITSAVSPISDQSGIFSPQTDQAEWLAVEPICIIDTSGTAAAEGGDAVLGGRSREVREERDTAPMAAISTAVQRAISAVNPQIMSKAG